MITSPWQVINFIMGGHSSLHSQFQLLSEAEFNLPKWQSKKCLLGCIVVSAQDSLMYHQFQDGFFWWYGQTGDKRNPKLKHLFCSQPMEADDHVRHFAAGTTDVGIWFVKWTIIQHTLWFVRWPISKIHNHLNNSYPRATLYDNFNHRCSINKNSR